MAGEVSVRSPLLRLGSGTDTDEQEEIYSRSSVQVKVMDSNSKVGEQNVTSFVVVITGFAAVGQFLFGYDTGVVSGAMLLINNQFDIDDVWHEGIVSATIGCAALFALLGGPINDRIGRKYTGILSGIAFTAGSVILGSAVSPVNLLIGRSVVGIGLGLSSMTLPMYISECAPANIRGRLVLVSGTFGCLGMFTSNVVDGFLSYDKENGWRYMLGLAALPAFIMTVGFFFLPESPRWLISKRKYEQANKVLKRIRNSEDVIEELTSIKKTCEVDEALITDRSIFILGRILRHPPTRRALIVGCGLQMFQQLSAINTVMYYTATIIKTAGITDDHKAIWLSAGVSGINVCFTIVGMLLVDRIGRRKLILASYIGVIGGLVILAVGFEMVAFNSPHVTVHEMNSTCDHYRICEGCIREKACGFCFQGYGGNGSCLPADRTTSSQSMGGRCSANFTDIQDFTWAYNYCPTDFYWVPLMGMAIYLVFFAPGLAGVPWIVNAEVYPVWARSTGNALSTATNWIFNVIVSMTFLSLAEVLTNFGVFWLYTGISIVGLVFVAYVLPETKGKSLEEMEQLFRRPWC